MNTVATSVKQILKRVRVARVINAALKNVQLERTSRRVGRIYARRLETSHVDTSDNAIERMVRARMATDGTRRLDGLDRRPVVFLVGTEYEQERAGFIQGVSACADIVALKRADGSYGLKPGVGQYDRTTVEENTGQIIQQVEAALPRHPVDALIGTMVAQYLDVAALEYVRARGIPVLNIAMDDRLPDHWHQCGSVQLGAIGLARAVDLTLQTTPEYVPRYLVEGHPATFWPFGSDPSLFAPATVKDYDVSFVGNNYGWRGELIQQISAAGIEVHCFGRGFPNGHIGASEVARVLGRSKIVLGVGTVAHSRRIVTLKLRDVDGPMSGSLYVTTHNPDLSALYDIGREIVTYRSPRECIRLLQYYLSHDAERQAIAAAGRARAARDHTWRQRIVRALAFIGLRSSTGPCGQ
jgi:glycosyl transferase family 1